MVQTLATMLMTHVQKPTFKDCSTVAKSLIMKHQFLKDDEGDGQVCIMHVHEYMCLNCCAFVFNSILGIGSSIIDHIMLIAMQILKVLPENDPNLLIPQFIYILQCMGKIQFLMVETLYC